MKILILTNCDVGLYKFRKELIEELLKDSKVIISLPCGEMVSLFEDMGCKFIDVKLDRRGINPLKDYFLYRTYDKLLKQEKPDLVITYTIKPNIYGGFICKKRKIPYAVNITGLGTAFQNENLLKKVVVLMYKMALKKSKVVFFENIENKEVFEGLGIVSNSQSCLLNGAGVNLAQYSYLDYPERSEITHFLFIGRIMREKGIEELFASVKKLNENGYKCTLSVLGEFEEDYAETIDRHVKEGWLNYCGFQKDVRPYIEKCHCFVLPSWHEGMANTNLECAASGRPVITSNIHGCKEAVINNKTGFLCSPRDADSLYNSMKSFIQLSYNDKKKMGINGRKHMECVFDKRIVVKKTLHKLF
ncbi:MAG: glycosyltransferase family 4 protein [Ruminococcus sp.]